MSGAWQRHRAAAGREQVWFHVVSFWAKKNYRFKYMGVGKCRAQPFGSWRLWVGSWQV
jgi:hypothetical protein